MEKKTLFVTFYSYKGGVGRTLSLANTAFQLAKEGKRVVLVDFDLEAPGLHNYPFCRKLKIKRGLVEYITDYVEQKSIPDIKNYLYHPTENKYKNLTLLPAGACDAAYRRKLVKLDWDILYNEYYGFEFFESLKSDLVKACNNPDYVFIDSRTGLTDTGNICTLQLPDVAVLFFSLNNQNREGIERVYGAIKAYRHPEIPAKKTGVIPVASPVPYGEAALKNKRLSIFAKLFNERILILPYHPRLAFTEIFIFEGDMAEEDICDSMNSLVWEIKRLNPRDTEKYWDQVNEFMKNHQLDRVIDVLRKITEIDKDKAEAWSFLGVLLALTQKPEEALPHFDRAIALAPRNAGLYSNKGNALCVLERYKEALPLYHKAIELDPNNARLYYNKALALFHSDRYTEALPLYDKAIELEPEESSFYFNKAITLRNMERYEKAVPLYDKAIELDPKDASFYYNKGEALCDLKHYEEALPLYDKAIELDPNDTLFYIGKALPLSKLKRYEDVLALCDKAIEVEPKTGVFYSLKARTLCKLKRCEGALPLFDEAIALDPQFAQFRYDKACGLAQFGRKREAISSLRKAIRLDPKSKAMAKKDSDLKPLRSLSTFQKLVQGTTRKKRK